ncbi:Zinc finger CCCH domain-containing protein 17 [Glycine max]|nr:Zinc finger CCCH domain-containing protein 17 [Glycine max]
MVNNACICIHGFVVITGIALPVGSDKLYSGSTDGTVRIWDCHTGQCAKVINLGAEVTSLISEGSWILLAWNIQTMSEFTLDGPKGRVRAMTVGNNTSLLLQRMVSFLLGEEALKPILLLNWFVTHWPH